MKVSTLIKKLFKRDNMTDELYRQAAYHESGHIIMAYLVGFVSEYVTLFHNEPGNGLTKFNYGQNNLLVAAILNAKNDGDIFNSLPIQTKRLSPQVAQKICYTLLGGPVTEAIYKSGVGYKGCLEIDMVGPDLLSVTNIDYFLSQIARQHSDDFIQHALSIVVGIIRKDQFWSAINNLSETIINSPNKSLTQVEIENSLQQSGYLEYIATRYKMPNC